MAQPQSASAPHVRLFCHSHGGMPCENIGTNKLIDVSCTFDSICRGDIDTIPSSLCIQASLDFPHTPRLELTKRWGNLVGDIFKKLLLVAKPSLSLLHFPEFTTINRDLEIT